MIENLKNQNTNCSPDVSRIERKMKAIQRNDFLYPRRKFGKEERSFLPVWYEKWTWLHNDDTVRNVKICIKDFFSKCDQIHRELRIWSHFTENVHNGKLHFFVQCQKLKIMYFASFVKMPTSMEC